MKLLLLLFTLFSLSDIAFGLDKIIKAPTGKVIIGATANVRTSEGAGTTTLTASDAREQIFNLSAARTVKLPTTGIKAGEVWVIKNRSTTTTAILTIQSSGANTLGYNNSTDAKISCIALQDTPTSAAHWQCGLDFSRRTYLCGQSGHGDNISYNNGIAATLSTNRSPDSVLRCTLRPYHTIDGTWFIDYTSAVSVATNASSCTVTTNGVVYKNYASSTYYQALAVRSMGNGFGYGNTNSNTETFVLGIQTGGETLWSWNAQLELEARPTWAY